MPEEPVLHPVREVTREEASFFQDHGWAHLPALVTSAHVEALRATSLARMAARGGREPAASQVDRAFRQDRDIAEVAQDFRQLAHHPVMGRNAVQLLGTVRAVRLQVTNILVKEPWGRGGHSGPTAFHQDFPWMPMDRSAMLTFWIALAPVSADMGSLRFYDRSHRHGVLGRSFVREGDATPNQQPWLASLPIVEGVDLQPGDATVHHALTVHGAPENKGTSLRLSFAATYFDADALYTGAAYQQTDGLRERLDVNEPFDHPRYPVIGASPAAC